MKIVSKVGTSLSKIAIILGIVGVCSLNDRDLYHCMVGMIFSIFLTVLGILGNSLFTLIGRHKIVLPDWITMILFLSREIFFKLFHMNT